MDIQITCPCGAKFRVDRKHVGRRTKCPKCGRPIEIAERSREPSEQGDRYAVASEPAAIPKAAQPQMCPSCGGTVEPGLLLCPLCSKHLVERTHLGADPRADSRARAQDLRSVLAGIGGLVLSVPLFFIILYLLFGWSVALLICGAEAALIAIVHLRVLPLITSSGTPG